MMTMTVQWQSGATMRDGEAVVVSVACPPARVPSSAQPLFTPARVALIISAFVVCLGLLGMHTLLTGHHSSAGSPIPTAVYSGVTHVLAHATDPVDTEARAHAADRVHTDAAAASIPGCPEDCGSTGVPALCMAVITGLVLVWLSRRPRRAYGPSRRYEARSGPGTTTKVVPRQPIRLLICVDRT